jgi:hypothetical protein
MPETVCYRVESSHRKSAFSASGIAPPLPGTFLRSHHLPFWVHRTLAACHGQLGNIDKARAHWARLLEEIPDANAAREFTNLYAREAAVHEHWYEGLQKAGLTD